MFLFVTIRLEAYYVIANIWLTCAHYLFNILAVKQIVYTIINSFHFRLCECEWLKPSYLPETVSSFTSHDHATFALCMTSWLCMWHLLRDSENLWLFSDTLCLKTYFVLKFHTTYTPVSNVLVNIARLQAHLPTLHFWELPPDRKQDTPGLYFLFLLLLMHCVQSFNS